MTYDCAAHCGAIVSSIDEVCRVCTERDQKCYELGRAAEEYPHEFWPLLSPTQAIALLRAAPNVAGPRERVMSLVIVRSDRRKGSRKLPCLHNAPDTRTDTAE